MEYPSTRRLDHIIHLSAPGRLHDDIERFKGLGFNVIPGGVHADGLTSNALVILSDGVYIELIQFNCEVETYPPGSEDRTKRERHWWASKSPGWIDWANQAFNEDISNTINGRDTRVRYEDPMVGGRVRPDGHTLKWRVAFPGPEHGRGTLPFYCEDLTPREARVPNDPPTVRQHRQGELGVAYIHLITSLSSFTTISQQLSAVLGTPAISHASATHLWNLETPSMLASGPILRLSVSNNSAQTLATIQEVGFKLISSQEKNEPAMGEHTGIILCI